MMEILKTYWYLWLVLLALVGVLVWASVKASAAVKKRNAHVRREQEAALREKRLAEAYANATPGDLLRDDPAEAVEGVAAALQRSIELQPDIKASFAAAPRWRQQCYALQYFLEDTRDLPSTFYRKNGAPLTGIATDVVGSACPDLRKDLRALYAMLDEDNEGVSVDKQRKEQLDASLKARWDEKAIVAACAAKIAEDAKDAPSQPVGADRS